MGQQQRHIRGERFTVIDVISQKTVNQVKKENINLDFQIMHESAEIKVISHHRVVRMSVYVSEVHE